MAKGVSVSVAADTRAFLQGVKQGVVEPLQTVDETLKQVTASGDHAGTDLEQTFREQQRGTQLLKGDIDSLNQTIKQGSSAANRQVRQDTAQTKREVSEGYSEMKDSAKQNTIQTAASFNGSFDSISGGAQGLLSEFAAGFGPAGLLAGVVAAGGLGLLTTVIDNATNATQVDQQAVADLAKQYIDAGTKGKRAFSDVTAAIEDMATNTDGSSIITLQTAFDEAGRAGANYKDIVESIASADPAQIQHALDRVQALKQTDDVTAKLGTTTVDWNAKSAIGNVVNQAAVLNLEGALKKAKAQADAAGKAQELAAEAGLSKYAEKSAIIGQLQQGYKDAAGSATDYINSESGLFDVSKYLSAMKAKQRALDEYAKHLQESRLTPEAKAFLDSQGADAAASMLEGYMHGSKAQQADLDRIWTTAGRSNVQSYGAAVGNDLAGLTFDTPPIRITPPSRASLEAARRQAQAYLEAHPLQAKAVAYTSYGKPLFN